MNNLGKKILSAFIEVTDNQEPTVARVEKSTATGSIVTVAPSPAVTDKFKQYFDQLFREANMPGPDYYEFTNMTRAMNGIADEKTRYNGAFAGLSVQGLDKNKLLDSAAGYIAMLETDAANFNATVDTALNEKVAAKRQEIQSKQQRMEQLSREISDLQSQIQLLQLEVKENEEKIENNLGAYKISFDKMKERISNDIEKIKQYVA